MAYEIITADLDWEVDDDGDDCATGVLYEYIIDTDNELAVFHGDKCIATRQCKDMSHAEAIAGAFEIECKRNIKRGCDWWGKPFP